MILKEIDEVKVTRIGSEKSRWNKERLHICNKRRIIKTALRRFGAAGAVFFYFLIHFITYTRSAIRNVVQ